MKTLFLTLILISSSLFADDSKIYVQSFDADAAPEVTDPKLMEVRKGVPREHNLMEELPSVQKMREIIAEVRLDKELAHFDEMDLDILFSKIKKYPLSKVQASYPTLDGKKLSDLRQKIGVK